MKSGGLVHAADYDQTIMCSGRIDHTVFRTPIRTAVTCPECLLVLRKLDRTPRRVWTDEPDDHEASSPVAAFMGLLACALFSAAAFAILYRVFLA